MSARLELVRRAKGEVKGVPRVFLRSESAIPPAWMLLFGPEHAEGDPAVLRAPLSVALGLAGTRIAEILPVVSPEVDSLLRAFVKLLRSAGDGTLVVDAGEVPIALRERVTLFATSPADAIASCEGMRDRGHFYDLPDPRPFFGIDPTGQVAWLPHA